MDSRTRSSPPERKLRAALFGALVGATLAASGPAGAQLFADDDARRAILDLRGRVDQMQRELLRRIEELQSRLDQLEAAGRGQLENLNQIQALRQEVAGLRGQLEVQMNEISQTQRRQSDLASDLDARVKRFEPVAVTIDGRQVYVDINERRAFDGAMALFRSGDFRGAAIALQQFQGAYPQSAYIPGVLYWLGSSQYAARDQVAAINTLRQFVQRYPDHPQVPDAILTVGNAHADAGDRQAAAETYRVLIDRYSATPAAQTARERLAAVTRPAPPPPAPPQVAPPQVAPPQVAPPPPPPPAPAVYEPPQVPSAAPATAPATAPQAQPAR